MSDEQRPARRRAAGTYPRLRHSRRRFLRVAAATGAVAAVGIGRAQTGPDFVLGGDTPGWEGREPESIAGETNPTLSLQAGETYVVEWENVDGQPHNFAIEDGEGTNLVESEVISEGGATQTVEFEATAEMAEYYCEVHPTSMRGDVEMEGEAASAGTQAQQEATSEGFFPEGPTVGVSTVADGMTAPTDFAVADDGRTFVTDQTGELWVLEGGERLEEPVLDVSDRMVTLGEFAGSYATQGQAYDERGLLGVEPHPEFADNGRLFVHYSAPPNDETPEGWDHVEVVSEFAVGDDGTADPNSETVVIEFQSPQYNHDGGPIAFGPDGYLYVPMGDGGGANDSMYGHVEDWYDANEGGNGQDTEETLLGGVHRIDVDGETSETSPDGDGGTVDAAGEDGQPYAVPDDNPLVDQEGHLPEYYAWGFRNPFGISFDSEDRLFVADAGQALFEEANIVEAGGNYGWNVKEGTHCFSTADPGEPPAECPDGTPEDVRGGEAFVDPIVEYPHTYQGSSEGIVIVGGHVYEAGEIEALQGGYVFGDWTRDPARDVPDGRLFVAMEPDDGAAGATPTDGGDGTPGSGDGTADGDGTPDGDGTTGSDADAEPSETVPLDELWNMSELVVEGSDDGSLGRFVRQFGQGPDGEVYVLVSERGVPEGETGAVLELVPPGEGEELSAPETPAAGGT